MLAARPRPADRPRPDLGSVQYVQANAERLPFADGSFDCITIGFGLRNVTDKPAALASMRRALKPGGQLLVLEFSQPRAAGAGPPVRRLFVPRAAAGSGAWSRAMPRATATSPNRSAGTRTRRRCSSMMQTAGLEGCRYHNLMRRHRGRAPRLQVLTMRSGGRWRDRARCSSARSRAPRPNRRAHASCSRRSQGRRLAIARQRHALAACIESTGIADAALELLREPRAGRRCAGDAPADATIIGAPLSLLALAGAMPQAVIRRGDVQISGDAELAQQFRELGAAARPDLEEQLARVIGRSGAHLAACAACAALADWTPRCRLDLGAEPRRVPGARARRPGVARRGRAVPARRGRAARGARSPRGAPAQLWSSAAPVRR